MAKNSTILPTHHLYVKGPDKDSFRTRVGALFAIEKDGATIGFRVAVNPGIALMAGSDMTAWPVREKGADDQE